MIFGVEGMFIAKLQEPGNVWLQSQLFSRLTGRMMSGVGFTGGKEETTFFGGVLEGN